MFNTYSIIIKNINESFKVNIVHETRSITWDTTTRNLRFDVATNIRNNLTRL